jgi:hypothetical protein
MLYYDIIITITTTPILPTTPTTQQHPPVHLQSQSYITKCCLYLDQPPCYKMLLGFLMVDQ